MRIADDSDLLSKRRWAFFKIKITGPLNDRKLQDVLDKIAFGFPAKQPDATCSPNKMKRPRDEDSLEESKTVGLNTSDTEENMPELSRISIASTETQFGATPHNTITDPSRKSEHLETYNPRKRSRHYEQRLHQTHRGKRNHQSKGPHYFKGLRGARRGSEIKNLAGSDRINSWVEETARMMDPAGTTESETTGRTGKKEKIKLRKARLNQVLDEDDRAESAAGPQIPEVDGKSVARNNERTSEVPKDD